MFEKACENPSPVFASLAQIPTFPGEALIFGNENAQEIGCEPFIRRSDQPGTFTCCIQDTFNIFHLNPRGISMEKKRA